jgi:hypothetical protein
MIMLRAVGHIQTGPHDSQVRGRGPASGHGARLAAAYLPQHAISHRGVAGYRPAGTNGPGAGGSAVAEFYRWIRFDDRWRASWLNRFGVEHLPSSA